MLFSSYVENKDSFPRPLSPEKEKQYLEEMNNGSAEAKEILINHNMRLVVHVAKKYSNYPDQDELISVGSIGLIKAINTYKTGKGTQLATYAARCIENEILMTLRANKKVKANISLHEPVGTDKEGNEISLIDLLSIEQDSVINEVETNIIKDNLLQAIKKVLDKREYEIISLRYGLIDGTELTQMEVASRFNISRSYISRIEKKAIQKIRLYKETRFVFLIKRNGIIPFLFKLICKPSSVFDGHLSRHKVASVLKRFNGE